MTDLEESTVFRVDQAGPGGGRGYKVTNEIAGAIMGRVYKAVEWVLVPGAAGVLVPQRSGGCTCRHLHMALLT